MVFQIMSHQLCVQIFYHLKCEFIKDLDTSTFFLLKSLLRCVHNLMTHKMQPLFSFSHFNLASQIKVYHMWCIDTKMFIIYYEKNWLCLK
jgi:hypothetical protein